MGPRCTFWIPPSHPPERTGRDRSFAHRVLAYRSLAFWGASEIQFSYNLEQALWAAGVAPFLQPVPQFHYVQVWITATHGPDPQDPCCTFFWTVWGMPLYPERMRSFKPVLHMPPYMLYQVLLYDFSPNHARKRYLICERIGQKTFCQA